MHTAEGWGSSTPEPEDLSRGFFGENSQSRNPSFVEHLLQAHRGQLASSCQYQGGINTILWMDTPDLRLKRTHKACKSVVLFKSWGFSWKEEILCYQQWKFKSGRAPAEKERCCSVILVEATAFHKDLWAAASLRVIYFFNLNLSYTHLLMLKLSTACKIPIEKLTVNQTAMVASRMI